MFAIINTLVAIINSIVISKESIMNFVLQNALVFILIAVYFATRSIIFVVRQAIAQNKVKVAYSRLTMWRNRSEEGYDFVEYDVATKSTVRWDIDTMESLVEKYQAKFNAAVEARDSIRF